MSRSKHGLTRTFAAALCLTGLLMTGCQSWKDYYVPPPPPEPLGALSDSVWQNQEVTAEASKFMVFEHEFKMGSERLNMGGEDHVKQIAVRLQNGQDSWVMVQRSMSSARPDTEYQYRVHPNPELDLRRREILVRSLTAMGVADAEQRVIVAPALSPGATANEAVASYYRGLSASDTSSVGIGGGGGFGGFLFRGAR
ncbi:MAG: hypothetical protein V3R99_03440 [Thermoguttaceae bacterium]